MRLKTQKKEELDEIIRYNQQVISLNESADFQRKKGMHSNIRHSFVDHLNQKREHTQSLQNELAEMYRNRKDNLKVGITERLKKIEEME